MTCDCESNLKIIREQFLDQLMYRGYISRDDYQLVMKDFGLGEVESDEEE